MSQIALRRILNADIWGVVGEYINRNDRSDVIDAVGAWFNTNVKPHFGDNWEWWFEIFRGAEMLITSGETTTTRPVKFAAWLDALRRMEKNLTMPRTTRDDPNNEIVTQYCCYGKILSVKNFELNEMRSFERVFNRLTAESIELAKYASRYDVKNKVLQVISAWNGLCQLWNQKDNERKAVCKMVDDASSDQCYAVIRKCLHKDRIEKPLLIKARTNSNKQAAKRRRE